MPTENVASEIARLRSLFRGSTIMTGAESGRKGSWSGGSHGLPGQSAKRMDRTSDVPAHASPGSRGTPDKRPVHYR